ncbi:MAG: sulfur carrier protein ThiS [Streptosporangiaceae bacterium]
MTVMVNGEPREVGGDATIAGVVATVIDAPSGVAVALNGDVIARGDWETTRLDDGDRLEVLTAVQGG